MKLDRNITEPRRGKYALIKLRTAELYPSPRSSVLLADWRRDDHATQDCLLMADVHVTLKRIKTWTDTQCQNAEAWAGAIHLRASNNIVRVPPKPACIG